MAKSVLNSAFGVVSSLLLSLVGGWDYAIATLIIFMAADYATGLIVGIKNRSKKTDGGGLSSSVCFWGLVKKCFTLVLVIVAVRLDGILGTTIVRDGVCAAFIVNETISILENVGTVGVPIPKAIVNAIDVLKNKKDVE